MKSEYNKELFDKLPYEKQDRILQAAIVEFSDKGFTAANINTIATEAGVSVGSLYKYFNNKGDFYLAIIDLSVSKIRHALSDIIIEDMPFFSMVEKIILSIQKFSREEMPLSKLYNQMTTESNAAMAWQISSTMEGVTANLYSDIIKKAQENGELKSELDPSYAAFFLDNLFVMLQFSYSCEYYKDRMKMFISADALEDDDKLLKELMKFIRGALT